MASITIHLAAANAYLRNHPNEHDDELILGTIAPDYYPNPELAHHSAANIYDSGKDFLLGKICLKKCLSDFDINTSFGKGYFLHLIIDDRFYRLLAQDIDKFERLPYRDFKEILYRDYCAVNDYFKKQYDVVFPKVAREYDISEPGTLRIINIDDVCNTIEEVSRIDLCNFYNELKQI